MSINIPLTLKDRKRIEVYAASEGLTVKDFVIECIQEKIHPEKTPNQTTRKALDAARKGKVFRAKNFRGLCEQIGL